MDLKLFLAFEKNLSVAAFLFLHMVKKEYQEERLTFID